MEKYKTVHQNKNEIEQFYSELTSTYKNKLSKVLNDLDLDKYSSKKFEYKEEDYWIKRINNLQRYYNSVEHGCPVMEEYEYGEYVKLEDVLELISFLFSAKKD